MRKNPTFFILPVFIRPVKEKNMKYQKFNDPSAILLDLCLPFSEGENVLLLQKGVEFEEDEQHKQKYMRALKSFYFKNFADIKSGNYVLQRFSELNERLEAGSNNFDLQNVPLMPEYMVVSDNKTNKDKRLRIQKLLKDIKSRGK